jgi:hypothetical protein
MVVYCPGCGAKISAQPTPDNASVSCPRCQSTFTVEGVKASPAAPPVPRLRKKKVGSGRFVGVLIFLIVLLVLGGGTAGVLYYMGVIGSRTPSSSGTTATNLRPTNPGSAAALTGWKDFENSEAKFSARFPGSPKRTQRTQRGRARDVAFELESNGVAYGVVYADLDKAGLTSTTPEQYIEQQQQALSGGGKHLQSEKAVTLGPYKGKEFVVDVPGQKTAHMRFFAAGRRLYSVLVLGKSRAPEPNEVAALFDSFRILD